LNDEVKLPEPVGWMHRQGNHTELSESTLQSDEFERGWTQAPLYTADQLREYARAAVLAERERCAMVCEGFIPEVVASEADRVYAEQMTALLRAYFAPVAAAIRKAHP
jgi:hypothetical protein